MSRAARILSGLLLGLGWLGAPSAVSADTPAWLQALAYQSLPTYPSDTEAVVLLEETITTVDDTGEIRTLYRRACKILRPEGRSYGTVVVHFDDETRVRNLKGWSIPVSGKGYEVKEKDAIETSLASGNLYGDKRHKLLTIPAADPGSVVGYEFEQRRRPYVLQDRWWFQEFVPVRRARYTLRLPPGWEFDAVWRNHPPQEPRSQGSEWVWELENIPAVKSERHMPSRWAVSGSLAVAFRSPQMGLQGKSHTSWQDVGSWFNRLAEGRRQADGAIQQKVAELTAGATTAEDRLRALAAFLQRDIRYVAIEIGIGGYQPHAARDVFSNRYGDCKDKATLLSSMLNQVGIESYYVIVQTRRGVVNPDFASALSFNHVILAIRLPEEIVPETFYSVLKHERLGNLLLFDPTDSITPLGQLPPSLQANYGLLVTEEGGELVELPLLPSGANRLIRTAQLRLSAEGTLSGEVQEVRWGEAAADSRAELLDVPEAERRKVLESFLQGFLPGFTLQTSEVSNLEAYDQNLILRYGFQARNYAKRVGNLLLVRPRVLGRKTLAWEEKEKRTQPVVFSSPSLQNDIFEITLPAGYAVDELPPPVRVVSEFAEYESQVEATGNVLRYQRQYHIKDVIVPTERLDELKNFYGQVAADERNVAVLKRSY